MICGVRYIYISDIYNCIYKYKYNIYIDISIIFYKYMDRIDDKYKGVHYSQTQYVLLLE